MMVRRTMLFVLFLIVGSVCMAQENTSLRHAIDSMYKVDQAIQQKIMTAFTNKLPMDSIRQLEKHRDEIFKRQTVAAKEIYARYGYPIQALVGSQASANYFVLVQHADHDVDFQLKILPVLKKLAQSGDVPKREYAYLFDRVRRNAGKKQRYGTQPSYDSKGGLFDSSDHIIYPKDLARPGRVDQRRAQMGLEPLEQYYEKLLTLLGRPRKKI